MYQEAAQALFTVRDILRFASSKFSAASLFYGHGTTCPYEEAVYLVLTALSLSYNQLDACLDARLLPSEINQLLCYIEERITKHIPVPYLTKKAWQGDYEFYVDQRVIIPRSFIHTLLINAVAPWVNPQQIYYALDLCTGSGCLAIHMANLYQKAKIDAVDISPDALVVAAINIELYQLKERIRLIQSNLFSCCKPTFLYDLIVTNPPYVSPSNMANLPMEYRYEPGLALRAEQDGLAIILTILKKAGDFLSEKGILLMEVGSNRKELEIRYPLTTWLWLDTPEDAGAVCLLTKTDLSLFATIEADNKIIP
ncbi:MAG: 50S ribosomal protein L3 N(5)-glutamine methyltransferase [Neisseriales bacterium]|nr:MAG: 50S ribosomal protein L3 N(5)-glutamine methyltransferase [Neisseriales bacterium]